jgi:hypothetical protein
MRQLLYDVRILPVLTVSLAIAAALLAPERRILWTMAVMMWLHVMAHCRSTPLLVTIIAPAVFAQAEGLWPADCVLAAAAYSLFYVGHELEEWKPISPPTDAVPEGHRAGDSTVAV